MATWPGNQWPSELLAAAIEEAAVAQHAVAQSRGNASSLDDVRDKIAMEWLDHAFPAGNA